MATAPGGRRLLLVHAHPDDESITTGATMARYVAEGAAVTLVTCTSGEEGEILVPELAGLAADRDDALGGHRVAELAAAMAALGVTDSRALGGVGRYRDSGMLGTPANRHPACFWRADLLEAADLLVEVLREVRPQVLLTYDVRGGYGHPDHVMAHRVATYAVALSAVRSHRPDLGPPWDVTKVYWHAVPRRAAAASAAAVAAATTPFLGVVDVDGLPFVVPDDAVDASVDATPWLARKAAALAAHATQVSVADGCFALSNGIGQLIDPVEHFRLAKGVPGPADRATGREGDLFAGLP